MRAGRAYFALQAVAGAVWWALVFASPLVRTATLGDLPATVVAAVDIPLFVVASALAACGVRAAAGVATGWTVLVAVALAVYATVTTEAGWGGLVMAAAVVGSLLALSAVVLGRVPVAWINHGPFAFRPAAPRSTVVVPTRGRGTPLPAAMPNHLVIAGPYRWVRNPMAVASIAQGVAVGLLASSWLVVAYAIAGALLWNYAVRPGEESDLEERFGEPFVRYRRDVRCWVPRVPRAASG